MSSCQDRPSPDSGDGTAAAGVAEPFSLDELQRRTFLYFWERANEQTNWQVPDRWPTEAFSSIAATGFGLSSYLIGIERGFISRQQGAERVLKTLQVLANLPQGPEAKGVAGYKGFFYHFLTSGQSFRFEKVELSSIDTALLMAGVLSAMSYFDEENPTESEIRQLADFLYRRVEWDWMMKPNGRMSMGWHPESGFIQSDWHGYNEAMILLLMAMGSPSHPIPADSWQKWSETYVWDEFQGYEYIQFDPLFGYQYSHIWVDFRGIQDDYMRSKGIDYFENSRRATLANQAWCMANPMGWAGYGENCWGLTACDGPANEQREYNGRSAQFWTYRARGACSFRVIDDGTIAPTAAGASVPFAPQVCIPALEYMWNTFYHQLVGAYGFKDAFNLSYTFGEKNQNGWFDADYLGIDQGPILLQIENYRSGFLWNLMKKNPYLRMGLAKAAFAPGR